MMISKPFATIKKRRELEPKCAPHLFLGLLLGRRRSALTVPEASAKVNLAQFPSRHEAHASVSSFGSGINFAAIGSESQMFFCTKIQLPGNS